MGKGRTKDPGSISDGNADGRKEEHLPGRTKKKGLTKRCQMSLFCSMDFLEFSGIREHQTLANRRRTTRLTRIATPNVAVKWQFRNWRQRVINPGP